MHGDLTPDNPGAAPVVPDGDRLDTAESIHAVMARILRGQATGKFRAREATAMMHSCQMLLYALPRLAEEREKVFADPNYARLNGFDAVPDGEDQQAECVSRK